MFPSTVSLIHSWFIDDAFDMAVLTEPHEPQTYLLSWFVLLLFVAVVVVVVVVGVVVANSHFLTAATASAALMCLALQ